MSLESDSRLIASGPAFDLAGLLHRVREPAAPGPHRAVVMLHGRGGDENVMWVFARTASVDWLLVAPRAIKPDPDGGYAWHPRKPDEWPPLTMFDEAVAAVVKLILALPQLYDADPGHIYLMGFSQGAAAAYTTALRHPGLVRGIAGLVGFMPVMPDEGVNTALRLSRRPLSITPAESAGVNTAPLKGLPVFMAVGKRDPTIPLEVAEGCARTLREAGAQLEYHAYDTGHKLDARGMEALKRWWAERN